MKNAGWTGEARGRNTGKGQGQTDRSAYERGVSVRDRLITCLTCYAALTIMKSTCTDKDPGTDDKPRLI